jgi:8-hydroxy-5-deazaflavin:NADPH oxidoreductase
MWVLACRRKRSADNGDSAEVQMKAKIGIIGNGNVGSALARGLARAGYEVQTTGKEPGKVRETGAWAQIVILAVPYGEQDNAVRELGETIHGKPVVDVSNALTKDMQLAIGFSTSAAEELQKKARDARVVKAFNTIFAQHMDKGRVRDEQLTTLVAGEDDAAKQQVLELARAIGFDAVDAGPLRNARWIEAMGFLNIQLGYVQKLGPQMGFRLVR